MGAEQGALMCSPAAGARLLCFLPQEYTQQAGQSDPGKGNGDALQAYCNRANF